MNKSVLAAFAVFGLAQAVHAEGYANHSGVTAFTERPCSVVLDSIEMDLTEDMIGDAFDQGGVAAVVDLLSDVMGSGAMNWGFILGYDTAKGGLHEGGATTLQRLTAQCAENPDQTAQEILDAMK